MQEGNVNFALVIETARWFTRIAGSLLFILIIVFFIGNIQMDGFPTGLSATEIVMFIAFFIILFGLVIGWFKELIASILIIGGFLVFSITNLVSSGRFYSGLTMLLFLIVGLLYLLVWYLTRKYKKECEYV